MTPTLISMTQQILRAEYSTYIPKFQRRQDARHWKQCQHTPPGYAKVHKETAMFTEKIYQHPKLEVLMAWLKKI